MHVLFLRISGFCCYHILRQYLKKKTRKSNTKCIWNKNIKHHYFLSLFSIIPSTEKSILFIYFSVHSSLFTIYVIYILVVYFFFFTRKVSTQKYALTTSFNARTPKKFQLFIPPLWGFSVCRYSCATQFTRNYTYFLVCPFVRPPICLSAVFLFIFCLLCVSRFVWSTISQCSRSPKLKIIHHMFVVIVAGPPLKQLQKRID